MREKRQKIVHIINSKRKIDGSNSMVTFCSLAEGFDCRKLQEHLENRDD